MALLKFETKQISADQLFLKATGVLNSDSITELKGFATVTEDLIATMHEKAGRLIKCVFDISEINEAKDPSAIAVLAEFQANNKPHILRTALVASKPEIKLAIGIVGAMAQRDNIQTFDTQEEAVAWAFAD